MDPLPDMPPGCEITATTDAGVVTLSWPAYKSGHGRYAGAGGLAFWLCIWAASWFFVARFIVLGRAHPFVLVWFAGWTVAGGCAAWHLWAILRPIHPEFVRLEADRLHYYPGRGPSEARTCAELPSGKVVPVTPSPATEVSRLAVRKLAIDRVRDRQRLCFDLDDRRIEIGGCLTESERAWLFVVLQQWLGEPRPAPPWVHTRPGLIDAPM